MHKLIAVVYSYTAALLRERRILNRPTFKVKAWCLAQRWHGVDMKAAGLYVVLLGLWKCYRPGPDVSPLACRRVSLFTRAYKRPHTNTSETRRTDLPIVSDYLSFDAGRRLDMVSAAAGWTTQARAAQMVLTCSERLGVSTLNARPGKLLAPLTSTKRAHSLALHFCCINPFTRYIPYDIVARRSV